MQRPRLAALVYFALLLGLSCSEEQNSATPASSSTSPLAQLSSPVATVTPTPELIPEQLPPVSTSHPLGTRTGIEEVDAILAAVEARDVAKLTSLVSYYPIPCTGPVGIGALPCPEGAPLGTPVEVFGTGRCEGDWYQRGSPLVYESLSLIFTALGSWPGATFNPAVHAVLRGPIFESGEVPGEAVIVYASGIAMSVDQHGLTYIAYGCGPSNGDQWLIGRTHWKRPAQYILAPLK